MCIFSYPHDSERNLYETIAAKGNVWPRRAKHPSFTNHEMVDQQWHILNAHLYSCLHVQPKS